MAFFTGGNYSVSANGIFIYDMGGNMQAHFMDNGGSENNKSWNRPIVANSTDWLIVVSGLSDRAKTPQPILAYRYDDGEVVGAPPGFDVCGSIFGIFGGAAALYFFMRR
jgi:hypothetical protein